MMEIRLKYWLFTLLTLVLNSCIEPYEADTEEDHDLICYEASLIKGADEQVLKITSTSRLGKPEWKPVAGCQAMIEDEQNHIFNYVEDAPGIYRLHIPDEELKFDRLYKLHVITAGGDIYESNWERIEKGTRVDTIYYQIVDKFDNIKQEVMQGIQFYIDVKASDTLSRFYRWKLTETYEFTSIAPITYYLTGDPLDPIASLDDERKYYRCWMTRDINEFFLSNTNHLSLNEKMQIPLYYVASNTERLKIKYSLLVRQFPLSSEAYTYWEKARFETKESGGLYTRQPGQPICNIRNVDNEEELVLGYFWASEVTEQRIIVPKPPSLEVYDHTCSLQEYEPNWHNAGPFPRYIWVDQVRSGSYTGSRGCFNCVTKGGELEKPEFW